MGNLVSNDLISKLEERNKNAYTFWCDDFQQRRLYSVCQYVMDSYSEGRISAEDAYCDCATAIKAGRCEAAKMSKEEEMKGKPIYFRERNQIMQHTYTQKDKSQPSYVKGWNAVGDALNKTTRNVETASNQSVVVKKQEPSFATPSYADVVNKAMRESEVSKADIIKMKLEIRELAKVDPRAAKEKLIQLRKLEGQSV